MLLSKVLAILFLLFARFAVLLQQLGIKVKLLCQPALVELLQSCSVLKEVEGYRRPKESDKGWRWVPLMSLPRRIPYLKPPWPNPTDWLHRESKEMVRRREHWRKILSPKPGHQLIGLNWQGNPNHENSLYSRNRSLPLKAWSGMRVISRDCFEFVALQKGWPRAMEPIHDITLRRWPRKIQ